MTTATIPVPVAELAARDAAKSGRTVFAAHLEQRSPEGRLVWVPGMGDTDDRRGPLPGDPAHDRLLAEGWLLNSLADAGEQLMLDATFRAGTRPTSVFGALYNDTPVDTDTLSTLTGEPSGSGYGRVTWACNGTDFPTLALDAGDFRLVGVQRSFTAAGGTIGPVTHFAIVSVVSGTAGALYVYMALSATRTLSNGDTLNVTPALKLA
jgi:hypothetical protein